jgi:leucyl aminopeptidase
MKISTTFGVVKAEFGAIAVGLFDDELKNPKLPALDRATVREISKLVAAAKFTAKKKQTVVHLTDRAAAPVLILQGLGARKDFEWRALRLAAGAITRAARDNGAKSVAIVSEDQIAKDLDVDNVTRALVEGIVLGDWRFEHYKKGAGQDRKELKSVAIHYTSDERRNSAMRILKRYQTIAECQNLARDWGTQPTNVVTTDFLANEAKKLKKLGVKVSVLERRDLKRLGLNLLLAVSAGTAMPPKLIIMDWHPRGTKKGYAFVGKGLVFDSGGLNIKTMSMEEMKSDMCGGAAVLAAMHGVAQLKPRVRIIGVIGAVENAIGPNAYRPSDIYTAFNGKTVEIGNTDAEGRLVLADALAYTVDKYKPAGIVDLATLTGAAKIALGSHADAVFTNNDNWQREILGAAERAGERVWPLPLFDEHSEEMKGDIADLKNIAGHRWGGACTGAAFLKEFVGKTPWVHMDIAPSAFPGNPSSIQPKATASGSGVRTLIELAMTR